MGKGCRISSTDLRGHLVAAWQPPHEGYLLLQVVEPAAQLGLAGAEHEKRGGQRACDLEGMFSGPLQWADTQLHQW